MKISKGSLEKFKKIKQRFLKKTKIPRFGNWKKMSNKEIWWKIIESVIVVGKSEPVVKFNNRSDLKRLVSYNKLSVLDDTNEITMRINSVLRQVGTRYASKNIRNCKKTRALVHNLKVLKNFREGPKGMLKRVASFKGRNEAQRKTKYLMKIFRYFKSKSARNFLMELGLLEDALAIDIRMKAVLRQVGIKVPKGLETNARLYDEVEQVLLEEVCKPLRISGLQFDRMLYQNYDEIKRMRFD